eukprot:SAG31_NODE_7641_length_1632_cov_3.556425_2_plen_87_part_00
MWGMEYPTAYLPLFNASARALKAVHPTLRVGGPSTMQTQVSDRQKEACMPACIPCLPAFPNGRADPFRHSVRAGLGCQWLGSTSRT